MSLFSKKISETETALTALQEQFESVNGLYDASKNEVIELTQKLATSESEFLRVNTELEELKNKLTESEQLIEDIAVDAADIDSIASNKALDIVAGLGVAPIATTEDETEMTVIEKLNSLEGTARNEFYKSHRAEILASLPKS